MLQKRGPVRPAHLEYTKEWIDRGQLILGGAWSDVSGAAIVLRVDSEADARRFAENDPYVKTKLVTSWRVKEWHVVVGLPSLLNP